MGFLNVRAREMHNRHPPLLIFPPVLHCVCVCVCGFSLVPSLCFIFNLGLHCKQIHRPDGGPAGWNFLYVWLKRAFFSLLLWHWLRSRSERVQKLPKWSIEVAAAYAGINWAMVKDVCQDVFRPEHSPAQHGQNEFGWNEKPISAHVHPAAGLNMQSQRMQRRWHWRPNNTCHLPLRLCNHSVCEPSGKHLVSGQLYLIFLVWHE